MKLIMKLSVLGAFALCGSSAHAGERDVQIRSIDFETGVIELFNCGSADIDMSQWRFCTHDEDEFRRYTAETGLVGFTIELASSFFVHTNNDAPGGSDSVNVSALGGVFATPMDAPGAFGMGLYFPDADGVVGFPDFGNGAQIADHIQWSEGGGDDLSADERSDEAVLGGVWTSETAWITTQADSTLITLDDVTCSELHGPKDYTVTSPNGPCNAADLAEPLGTLDFTDVVAFLTAFGTMDPAADLAPPIGTFDFTDVVAFLTAFGSGCP